MSLEPDLVAESGLACLPLFSSAPSKQRKFVHLAEKEDKTLPSPSLQQKTVHFTDEEEKPFNFHYENGYDLKHE